MMSGNVFLESPTGQDLHQVKLNNEGSRILEGQKFEQETFSPGACNA